MNNITIVIHASTTENVNMTALRQRIADQVREISNPLRSDEGLTTVSSVRVKGMSAFKNDLLKQMNTEGELAGYAASDAAVQLVENWDDATPMDSDFDVSLLHDIDDVCQHLQNWKKALERKMQVKPSEMTPASDETREKLDPYSSVFNQHINDADKKTKDFMRMFFPQELQAVEKIEKNGIMTIFNNKTPAAALYVGLVTYLVNQEAKHVQVQRQD